MATAAIRWTTPSEDYDPFATDVIEPDRFLVRRSPTDHLGFGGGVHYCLGAALAEMEGVWRCSRSCWRDRAASSSPERCEGRRTRRSAA